MFLNHSRFVCCLWNAFAHPPINGHPCIVKTLLDIERAAGELPPAQQTELLYFLAERLGDTSLPLPEPREFSAEQLEQWMDADEAAMRRFREGA